MLAIIVRTPVLKRVEGQEEDQSALPGSIEHPAPEDPLVEVDVLKADAIKTGSVRQNMFIILEVEDGSVEDGNASVDGVECGIHQAIVDVEAREQGQKPIRIDWSRQQNVLVEHVAYSKSVAPVGLSSMEE